MFVTVEGIEGSGKSSLIGGLSKHFPDALITKEPGDSKLGVEIRKLLFSHSPCSLAETFLFLADRAEHVTKVVRPALEQGQTVICDRFTDSTIAYQGYARGLSIPLLIHLNDTATNNLKPDVTLLLDLPPEVGLKRAKSRSEEEWTRFEQEQLEFHQRIRAGFLDLAKKENRFKVLDATKSQEEILKEALECLKN